MKNKSSSALFIGLLKGLSLAVLLPLTGVLAIALLLTMLAMFAGLLSGVGPTTVLSTLYRYVVPEQIKTEQLIKTSDGNHLKVLANISRYTEKYLFTLNVGDYPVWTYEGLNLPISSQKSPVVFDVVNKTPWIVLPVDGGKCAEYGFPREGFVIFKLESKIWKRVPYRQMPENLRVNLLQYANKDDLGKTIKEIFGSNMAYPNIANKNSCYYMHPVVDADEKRSLDEYVDMQAVAVQAKLVKESDNKIEISDDDLKKLNITPKVRGDCDKVVKRHYTTQIAKENQAVFAVVTGSREGAFQSPVSAERVELNVGANEVARSFYLPIRNFSTATISVMNCQSDRIVVDYGRDMNSLQVLEYNFNAQLLKKWSVQLPLNVHPVSDISIENNRIKIELVDFIRDEYFQGKKIPAKIIGQYSYEAELSL